MKTQISLFCLLLLLSGSLTVWEAYAKKHPKRTVTTEQSEATFEELGLPLGTILPTFQGGGIEQFHQWIQTHLQFPLDLSPRFTQATIMVTFVVETDGSMTITDMDDDVEPSIRVEIIQVFSKCPKWTPCMMPDEQSGAIHAVPIRYNLPFVFKCNPETETAPFNSNRSLPKRAIQSSGYDRFGNRIF